MARPAIGFKIRQRRKDLGITQASMARNLGISAPYLNLIEANKRSVGGKLLSGIADALDLKVEMLTGEIERRLVDDLQELVTDPLLSHLKMKPDSADRLVARYSEWSRALLTLYRAYLDNNQAVTALSDRMNRDPLLQESVHRMLTHITAIRSSAEILNETEDLEAGDRRRFEETIHSQSTSLSDEAQRLVTTFGQGGMENRSLSGAEEVDDFIIGHRNWFPELEDAATQLRRQLDGLQRRNIEGALVEFLQDHLDTRIENITLADAIEKSLKNQCHFDVDNRQLMFLVNAPTTTRRFQMMRVAAELTCMPQLEHYLNDNRLITEASRSRARLALASYIAGAALLPYDEFLDTTEAYRYDVEKLRQKYQAGYEQICHRLITLRRPLAEGVPFAFLRVDPSGHISKRFPLYGLPLPRYGHACSLWNVFTAFQTPSRVVRQLSEFPDGRRFLMIARTVTKRPAAFHAPPVMYAIMLACDKLHADRTIYSEGLDFEAPGTAIPVGPSCRMCNYTRCQQRQEDSLYSGLN